MTDFPRLIGISIHKWLYWSLAALAFFACSIGSLSSAQYPDLNEARVEQIAQMLPQIPAGTGRPCADRNAWGKVAPIYAADIQRAKQFLQAPIPAWRDDAYLLYSQIGDRRIGEAMIAAHDGDLDSLVLAECAQWHGQFLPRIIEQLDAISAQRSWTLPAHDGKLENFNQTRFYVDLNAANLGHVVAETLYLLGDQIPSPVRQRAMAALNRHMFLPVLHSLSGVAPDFWLRVDDNWNAVCLGGVTGAALAVLPDRDERAVFVAAAEHFSSYYLNSTLKSGYDVEGIGYWSYGFRYYLELREELWAATRGSIDLFDNPRARRMALFGFQFAMLPGVYADFGDARFMAKPDAALLASIDRDFNLHAFNDDYAILHAESHGHLFFAVRAGFLNHSIRESQDESLDKLIGLHTYYRDAGVLVERPMDPNGLAITIKAGGNGAHSHNDIGSYSIGLMGTQPVGDPGGPFYYTADTFTSKRFNSKLLNSYGHPVPEIDGTLQVDATKVHPKILSVHFSPSEDHIVMDISSAYRDLKLKRLLRTMYYRRGGAGEVEIDDKFEIKRPSDIVESFPTHGTMQQIDSRTFELDLEKAHVLVTIDAPTELTLTEKHIDEYGVSFIRIGIGAHLAHSGTIRMIFKPIEDADRGKLK